MDQNYGYGNQQNAANGYGMPQPAGNYSGQMSAKTALNNGHSAMQSNMHPGYVQPTMTGSAPGGNVQVQGGQQGSSSLPQNRPLRPSYHDATASSASLHPGQAQYMSNAQAGLSAQGRPNYQPPAQQAPTPVPVNAYPTATHAQPNVLAGQMGSLSLSNPQLHPPHPPSRPSYESSAPAYSPLMPNVPQSAGKIPSEQIPCPIDVRNADQETFQSFGSYRTSLEIVPPLTTTQVPIVDDGNCHPLFMRLTTFKVAQTSDILSQSGIPFGIVIQPFANVPYEIPVVDCSSGVGLERCKNCMAYINPFIIFGTGGRKYKCNLCMQENELRGESVMDQSYAGMYGAQQSVYRPELKYGSVEFIVPPEYVQRPKAQSEPFLLFAVDVSKPNLLPLFVNAIKRCINFLENGSIYRYVSIMAYERVAHFFNVSNPDNPSIVTAPDLQADYAPVSFTEFMFDIKTQGLSYFLQLLDSFPQYFEKSSRNDISLSSCVKFILNSVENHNGKIILFNTSHFGTGPDCLSLRDDVSPSAEKEKTLLSALKSDLGDVASRAAQNGICVDFFAISMDNFLDLASTSPLSSLSGGDLYYYQAFQLLKGDCLNEDLLRCISQVKAFECAAKLRASNGISVSDNFGPVFMRTSTEMLFGNASENKTFACLLQIDDKIPEKSKVSFQFAALYTDAQGVRRVRVHNLCVPVATNIFDLFGHSDCEAVANFLSKRAISLITTDSIGVIRDLLAQRISSILLGYRKYCSPNTSGSQLVLPESLKLLPIYMLALQKTKALNAFSIKSDLRVFWIRLISSLSLQQMAYLCYPRLYCLTNGSFPEEYLDVENAFPNPIPLTMENIDPRQVYCISSGIFIILYVGNAVDPQIVQAIFDVPSSQAIDPIRLSAGLPVLHNPLSSLARKLIGKFQEHSRFNPRSPALFVVRQGVDPMEHEFSSMMVHDQSSGIPAYVDYLCSLHSQVKAQLK